MPAIKVRSGQTATPILKLDGQWISGSAAICAVLEVRFPSPPLMPRDDAQRARVLQIEQRLDDDFGPRMRRAIFGQLLPAPGYLGRIFSDGQPALAQWLYGASIPAAAPLIKRSNGITGPQSIADCERAIDEACGFVEQRLNGAPYLVGGSFSLADIAACAFLAMISDFTGSPMEKPKPMPAALQTWIEQRSARPAITWARNIYARHRGAARDFDGEAPT